MAKDKYTVAQDRILVLLEENRELRKYQKDLEKTIWVRDQKIKKFEEYMHVIYKLATLGRFPSTGVTHEAKKIIEEVEKNG